MLKSLPNMFPYSFLILILFTSTPFSLTNSQPHLKCQIQVLLNLKQKWHTSPFVKYWHSSTPACTWPGIKCTNNSITGISLPSQNIYDNIPTIICTLTNLTFLNLSNNFIMQSFPIVLYNCSKLQTLDLSYNKFHGPLPNDIYKLSNIRYLDIGSNSFKGDIPSAIGQLTKLTYLGLHDNSFDGIFPAKIGNLVNLEMLSVGNNSFVPRMIPKEFGRLKMLNYLLMQRCNLIGNIPHSFVNLSNLKELDLSSNNLVGKIPSGLFHLKNLTSLYLYENNLTGEIPRDIRKLHKLEKLYLHNNQLTGSLPSSFANLSSLIELDLSDNNLEGVIPSGLCRLKNLTILRLLHNQLFGEIPTTIEALNLVGIYLDGNKLTGAIPQDFGKLQNLEKLYMYNNQLSGPIPESLTECIKLQSLNIASNALNGEVPIRLWMLPNIARLSLYNNYLTGNLPSQLSTSLYLLKISNNRFSGPIPLEAANWKSLVIFYASNNQLGGAIPLEFTALSKLNDLQLEGNFFNGDLPSRIISWKSLASLNLSRNNLSGPLPTALGSLPLVRYLDLSYNKLSGHIPNELGELILDKLDLSSNDLRGKVPRVFDNEAFQKSFLNNPKLCSDTGILNIHKCSASKRRYLDLILAIGATIFLVVLCVTFLFKANARWQRRKKGNKQLTWEMTAFHKLEFSESKVVSSLNDDNVIGSGGSGKVYRIEINDLGEKVAVKRIRINKKSTHSLEKQFLAEVEILNRIRHANIVKLLCCISSEDSNLLVYEYLENESLDKWLHKGQSTHVLSNSMHFVLDWPTRLKIAIGVAKGLAYMHHDCSPPIIHRDVKSSNILLDLEFNAKVADFGLAKISTNTTGEPYTASTIAGSFGYIAPEYIRTRRLNEKIDIYSFGVVLLELSTGKEPREGNDQLNLADWSQQHYHKGYQVEDALDNKIKQPQYSEEMINVFKLGIMCTNTIPSSRPSMKQVLELLISFSQGETSQRRL